MVLWNTTWGTGSQYSMLLGTLRTVNYCCDSDQASLTSPSRPLSFINLPVDFSAIQEAYSQFSLPLSTLIHDLSYPQSLCLFPPTIVNSNYRFQSITLLAQIQYQSRLWLLLQSMIRHQPLPAHQACPPCNAVPQRISRLMFSNCWLQSVNKSAWCLICAVTGYFGRWKCECLTAAVLNEPCFIALLKNAVLIGNKMAFSCSQ